MKSLKEILNESKTYKFKKGDKVTFKDEFSDDKENEFTYELIENPDGDRVKIQAIDSKLKLPPVEVVKLEWLVPIK